MALSEPLCFEENSPWRLSYVDIGSAAICVSQPTSLFETPTTFLVSILPNGHLTADLQDPSLKVWVLIKAVLARFGSMMLTHYFATDGEQYYPVCPFVSMRNHSELPYKISDMAESWEIRLNSKDQHKITELIQSVMNDKLSQ
ncbi:MAG: hypothetical protein NTX52_05295 [Planctomycetota bacterium]|nr:hypothetical protein [Planctomycetota bacterium]